MKIKLLSFVMASGVLFYSCKKNDKIDEVVNKSLSELSAPASFKWSGSRDVTLSIGITDNTFQNAIHVVKIYNAEPAKGGELISSGSATLIKPFNTKITLSSLINQVYVEKVSPNGTVVGQLLTLTSDNMSAAISSSGLNKIASIGNTLAFSVKNAVSVVNESAPTVPVDAIVVPNNADGYQMVAGKNYVINTNNASVKFNEPSGGTLYITATGVNITQFKMKDNNNVIITGSATFANNFSWDNSTGSTFKVFGTLNTSNFKVNGTYKNQGSHVISGDLSVVSGSTNSNTGTISVSQNTDISAPFENSGNITLSGTTEFKAGSNFTNTSGASIAFNGNAAIKGTFTNAGTATFGANINFNSDNPTINNSGTFTGTNSEMNLVGLFTNSGTVTVKTLTINSSAGKIINNCKFFVTENASINRPIDNYSYFRVTGSINVNSNGVITLYNGAFFRAGSIQAINVAAVGAGTGTSVFKVDGSIDNNVFNEANNKNDGSKARFSGSLELDLPSYSLNTTQPNNNSNYLPYVNGLPVGFFISPAKRLLSSSTTYIPSGSCMPEGVGSAPANPNPDSDGDGVPDSEDKFVNDPTRAYIIESENYANGGSTVAFEDSWPLKGDYDLNDVVINYKYQIITNAQNKVVGVRANYRLLATGGEFQNGAGIEFPVPAASVKNLVGPTGVSFESGQAKAVLILFTNSRAQQATWNTELGQNVSPVKEFAITFDVDNGPDQATFGVSNFNPFIWNNSPGFATRKFETHLFGKTPTTLAANSGLFGTGDDRTDGTRFYGTDKNLPWAITLPIANFKYPLERVPIDQGYKMFKTWAESGGTSTLDWYTNTSTTYRDVTKLFGN